MTERSFARRRGYVFLAALVLFVAFNANIPPMGLDESMYMTASQEMAASGDYLIPTYNGSPFFDKPPLVYWLQSASCAFFDVFFRGARLTDNLGPIRMDGRFFGYRAVSAGAALALLWLVMHAGRRLFGKKASLWAGAAFALSLLTCALAKMAIMDMLLTLWCSLSLFVFFFCYQKLLKKQWIIAAFACLGLALLTKGPVAFGIVGLPVLCFLAAKKRLLFMFDRYTLAGLLVMLAIAVPWYALAGAADGRFYQEFFVHQNLTRALGKDFAHGYNPLIYPAVILLGMAPWSLFLIPACMPARKKTGPEELFLVVWIVSLLIMFMLINSRLPGYIFPVFPPAAVLIGRYLDRYRPGKAGAAALTANVVLSLVLGGAVAAAPHLLTYQGPAVKAIAGAAGLWLAFWAALALWKKKAGPAPALAAQAGGFLLLVVLLLPVLALDPDTLKDEVDSKSDLLGTTGYILCRDLEIPSMSKDIAFVSYRLHPLQVNFPLLAERQVAMPADRKALEKTLKEHPRYLLVTYDDIARREDLDSLAEGGRPMDPRYRGNRGLRIYAKYF
ncbi:MAG: glycosyltransferase family 39 protein [Abditibacteriota bacterium]|nr:glycosyltransferase family 39 protein [Abditibacteriota bacterium]